MRLQGSLSAFPLLPPSPILDPPPTTTTRTLEQKKCPPRCRGDEGGGRGEKETVFTRINRDSQGSLAAAGQILRRGITPEVGPKTGSENVHHFVHFFLANMGK